MTRPTIDDARAALARHFGYPAFRPGQTDAVESVLSGGDTLVVLPTGGGKSLCYQVPALVLPSLTVVVSPLISLMKDQVDALARRGLPAAFINSTLTQGQIGDRLAAARRGELKLLYVAPERFDAGSIAERLREVGVSLLAVDEAHCVSEWGHDFRPSYLRLAAARRALGSPPVVALTATATPHVRSDIARQLELERPRTIITGFDRTNLHYHVVPTRTDADKDEELVRLLRLHSGLAVVYASTRKTVERIAGVIDRAGIRAAAYHAGLDDERRHEVQDAFMQERVRAIVATNAFGMGIDKPNVRVVIHYAMPGTLEAYYQEAGRAGRDGEHGDCFLLHAFQDRFTHEFFIRGTFPERPFVENVYAALVKARGNPELTPDDLASLVKGKASAREVESALRLLAQCGAYTPPAAFGSRVWVRLLATPERIRTELTAPDDALALGLLRTLWRAVGAEVQDGAAVDLEGLPPAFGGARAVSLLDALAARQFVDWRRTGGDATVDAARPIGSFRLDWEALERRRRAELAKLDAMQGYAYASGCRRGYVLRYFGDPAARAQCGGCDNCLGTHARRPAKAAAGRGGAPHKSAGRGRGGAVREQAPEDVAVTSPADVALLGRLREMRTALAREAKVPAYVIFPDRTLAEIAVRRPATLDALGAVRGVGAVKLERFGARILEIVRAADDTEAA